jgi:hypothetical protein
MEDRVRRQERPAGSLASSRADVVDAALDRAAGPPSAVRRILPAALAGALLAAALLAASPAGAVILRLGHGTTISYQPPRGTATVTPFDQFFANVDYNGGPVMQSNTNYAIYWRPSTGPSYPPDYQAGLNQYFEDLAHDSGGTQNVESVAGQYNDAAGEFASYDSHFGGAFSDTDPYPASGCARAAICLTDAQLRVELKSFVEAHGLPHDLAHEYFLLTPPGVEFCVEKAGRVCSAGVPPPHDRFCAYHGNIPVSEGQIIFANDPYDTGILGCDDGNHPNGTTSDGVLQGGLSHEHMESITDPEPNTAWTDFGGIEGEIGDKCAGIYGPALGEAPNHAGYNQLVNGHRYWYQEEWSNQTHQCLQRLTFSGEVPTATFTSTAGAGNEVKLDASGSTAPGGVVRYNWQFNDGPGPTHPTETSTPTVSHTFAVGGRHLIALTVFASDGTSVGTSEKVLAGVPPAPTIKRVTPAKGPASGGTAVTITGTNLDEVTAVSFGALPAASFTVNSATRITAASPADAAGTVDVTVTSAGGTSATVSGDHFRFGPPTVTEVSPNSGSAAGATSVTVTGTGFVPGTAGVSFNFGGPPGTSVNCSSFTQCTVVSPAHRAGVVAVRATVSRATSPTAPGDQFSYH